MIEDTGKVQSIKRTYTLIADLMMEGGIHMPRNMGDLYKLRMTMRKQGPQN